jgi:outer membrane protein OmpU
MTNLRKIGLTALAGTLAATTAHAGDLTVTGTATMEYQSTQDTINSNTDSFAQNGTIVFSGSGELDNGMGVSFMQALAGGTLTSQSVALDMGDMGTLSVASLNMAGIGTIQDMVPNAGEQPWDDLGTASVEHGTPEQGGASPQAGDRLGYSIDVGGAILSAAMNYAQNSPTTSAAIQLPNLVEGLNIGGGLAVDQQSATVENDIETYYITYSMGPISVGAQQTKVDHQTAASDIERDSYGVTFAVNENLSIGYGVSDTEFDAKSLDEENTGIQASYTSGGMTIGVVNNTKDNMGGDNTDKEMTELKLTFAF